MWEKELKKRELEVEHSERKMAAQTALISSLEVRIKDLEHSNRLLKLQISNSGIQLQNLDAYTQSGLPQNGVSNGRSHTQCCSHTHAAPPEHADMQAIKLSLQRLEMDQIRQRLDLHSDLIGRFNNPQQIIQPPPHGLPRAMPPPHIMRPPLIPNASYMHYNQHQYRDSWHPQAGPPTRTGPAHPDCSPGQPTHDVRPQNNNQNRFHSDSHKPPHMSNRQRIIHRNKPSATRHPVNPHTSDDLTSNRGRCPETYSPYRHQRPKYVPAPRFRLAKNEPQASSPGVVNVTLQGDQTHTHTTSCSITTTQEKPSSPVHQVGPLPSTNLLEITEELQLSSYGTNLRVIIPEKITSSPMSHSQTFAPAEKLIVELPDITSTSLSTPSQSFLEKTRLITTLT